MYNLITLDGKSTFDKIPSFRPMASNFLENVSIAQSLFGQVLRSPFIACGNKTITGLEMEKAFSEQCGQSIMDISYNIEYFENLKTKPYIGISDMKNFDTLFKAKKLKDLGFKVFVVYSENIMSDNSIGFLQRLKAALGEDSHIIVQVYDKYQTVFLRKNMPKDSIAGFLVKTPKSLSDIVEGVTLETIKFIRENDVTTDGNIPILLEDDIEKPLDAAKAIFMGVNGIVLSDQIAGSDESMAEIIEVEGEYKKLYSYMENGSKEDAIDSSGSVVNVLIDYESVLRKVMSITGRKDFNSI